MKIGTGGSRHRKKNLRIGWWDRVSEASFDVLVALNVSLRILGSEFQFLPHMCICDTYYPT
jgi:hypothetical protein